MPSPISRPAAHDQRTGTAEVRHAYDATASTYVDLIGVELGQATEGPLDRAILTAFVELATGQPRGRVADLGCGPGRVAAFLARSGVDVVGIDLSTAMADTARSAHPAIDLVVGDLAALPVADRAFAAAVCWYSIIHTPPGRLDEVFAEIARTVRPGSPVLVAFQSGAGEAVHRSEVGGIAVSLTSHRHDPDDVARRMERFGLRPQARIVREAALAAETTPQAFVLAVRDR